MLNEVKKILENNNIKYKNSTYADVKSLIIIKNNYQLEIYEDELGFLVSELKELPYKWSRMGFTTIDEIIEDLKQYLKIEIKEVNYGIMD